MIGGFSIGYKVKDGSSDELALQKMTVAFERAGSDFARLGEHLYPEIIPVFEAAIADQFLAEGKGPNRGKWAALSEKYAKAKRKKHGVRPILVATGAMMNALVNSDAPNAQRVYNSKQLNFGTSELPYASFHQTGTQQAARTSRIALGPVRATGQGSQKMPDRPIFDFADTFESAIQKTSRRVARKVAREHLSEFATVAAPEGA